MGRVKKQIIESQLTDTCNYGGDAYATFMPNGVFERNTIFWHQNVNDLDINSTNRTNTILPPDEDPT